MEDAVVEHIAEGEAGTVGVEVLVDTESKAEVKQVELGDEKADVVVVDEAAGQRYGVVVVDIHAAVVIPVGQADVAHTQATPRRSCAEAEVIVQVDIGA